MSVTKPRRPRSEVGTPGPPQSVAKTEGKGRGRPSRETDYRQLFQEDLSGVAVHEIICDASGVPVDYRFLEVNPAFEALTGLRGADIVGKRVLEVIPDLEPEWIERYGRVALTGRPEQFSSYNAGLNRHFDVRAYRPAPGQFAAVFHDVTQLRERSNFVETIIASAGEGIIVYDHDLRYVVWNPVMEELTGLPADEVLGKGAFEAFPEIMTAGVGVDLAEALADAAPTSREFEYTIPGTGRHGWVVQTNRPHRDANGTIVGVVSSVLDVTAKHDVEATRRRSEEEFRTIFDSVGDGVTISDPNGNFLEVNRVFCERLGYTREQLLSMPASAISSPEMAALIPDRTARIMSEGTGVFETTHIRLDGTEIPIEAAARRVEFRGRTAILSVQRDITERKRAQEAIQEQARFLQQLLDAIPIPIIAKDRQGQILLSNESFNSVRRMPHLDVVGKTVAELGLSDPESHLERDRVVLANGTPQVYEAPMPVAGGRARRHVITKAPLRAADGEIIGTVIAGVDINDRYEAEQAMKRSEERFRTLFESAGDAIFMSDRTGRFLEVNQAACDRLGYSREELLAMSVMDIDRRLPANGFEEALNLILQNGSQAFETEHTRRDGTVIPVETSATTIDLDGTPAILSIARDISERKNSEVDRAALEAQLREAQKMEGIARLAGGVAHDFNNLLTVIRGNASLVLADLPAGTPTREEIEEIEQAAARAADLTSQLLAFARRTVRKPEVVEPRLVVRGLEAMLSRLVGEDIVLQTITPDGTGHVLVDPGQLEQVIVNLVVNSRDAMPNGGTVTIEVADVDIAEAISPDRPGPAGPMTTLTVSDTGVGMSPATLERLFEPFYTTKDPSKGLGLGLATVYGIVRMSGGKVTASSELGRGSTMTVYLPRVEAAGAATAVPKSRPERRARARRAGTILVVEDDNLVRKFTGRVLETAGYTVLAAPNGAAAVELSIEVPLDLLLTDVVMPGMSGRDVAARLTAARPGLRVIYMSGHTEKGIVHDGVLEPGIEFLGKPFSAEALLAAVDRSLARGPAA